MRGGKPRPQNLMVDNWHCQIAGYIGYYREQSGLSQKQLAAKACVNPSQIARFETGEIRPSLDVLLRIIHAVGVTPKEFFG